MKWLEFGQIAGSYQVLNTVSVKNCSDLERETAFSLMMLKTIQLREVVVNFNNRTLL